MDDGALTRQPIFDRHLETVGYELGYGHLGRRNEEARDEAGQFVAALVDIGFETLVGKRFALVSLPVPFLVGTFP
jgi:c-di-GMP-related signal transduction protein